ncbi:hypothetical protein [Methanomassiliicoccus luminyensis]|uniref:hypothetical protein n=1 Tax=Methanomassiliicoccus luminyensis TaxID=1080712 RepID=UPI0003827E74|nr:hypothetical protein [Methanomassiliicoccus luminyensis]
MDDARIKEEMFARWKEERCIVCGNSPGLLPNGFGIEIPLENGKRFTGLKVCDGCRDHILEIWGA